MRKGMEGEGEEEKRRGGNVEFPPPVFEQFNQH